MCCLLVVVTYLEAALGSQLHIPLSNDTVTHRGFCQLSLASVPVQELQLDTSYHCCVHAALLFLFNRCTHSIQIPRASLLHAALHCACHFASASDKAQPNVCQGASR